MTLLTPLWLENAGAVYNAGDYRRLLAMLTNGATGVPGADDFAVSEKAGTADMSVSVAAGHVVVQSTRNVDQGAYHAYNDDTVNVAISAADATNGRIDRVCVRFRDVEQGEAADDVAIVVVEGTPTSSPAAPSIPFADYLELAQVTVPASATSVTDADIDDVRLLLPRPVRLQAEVSGGSTSGTDELTLATINVAAQPVPREIDVAAFWTGINSSDDDDFTFRIRVDGIERAAIRNRHMGAANERRPYSLPTCEAVELAAGASSTITVTVQRSFGTGTIDTAQAGRVTVSVVPQ